MDGFPEEEGKGETKWRARCKSKAQSEAREYRVRRIGRCEEIKRGQGSTDDVSNEPDRALHCGKPVDRAEREEQRQANVFLFGTCASRQTFEFVQACIQQRWRKAGEASEKCAVAYAIRAANEFDEREDQQRR